MRNKWLGNWPKIIFPVVSFFFGVTVALIIAAVLGESPLLVLEVLINGAVGSPTQWGYSLYYATPLLLTGLSVAWASRAGLFNIGAEGQMTMGGVAIAVVGILLPTLPSFAAWPLALAAAFLTGGLWGAFAGWTRAYRGTHEVLTTILLNFIAYGLASFAIVGVLKNPESQVPETAPIGAGYEIPTMSFIGGTSPLNWSFVISLFFIAIYAFVFKKTRFGFYQKLAGGAVGVGQRAGINMNRQMILAMFMSGGFAAMAAASPVMGFAHKTREGFTSNAGFIGIAVALLARNSPVGIIVSALLFGMLTKGALDLDLDTDHVSRDLAMVIQALVVTAIAAQAGLTNFWNSLRAKGVKK